MSRNVRRPWTIERNLKRRRSTPKNARERREFEVERLQYTLPNETEVVHLDCKHAFSTLDEKEKLYAHYLSRASWYGGLIVLFQVSSESPGIFLLLHKLFRSQSLKSLEALAVSEGFQEEDWQAFLVYSAGLFANCGNYKSFGDTKFVPNVPRYLLENLILKSEAYSNNSEEMQQIWEEIRDNMYDLSDGKKQLGFGDQGITTYYTSNITKQDAEYGQEFLNAMEMSAVNTRLFKSYDEHTGEPLFEVKLASSLTEATDDDVSEILGDHILEADEETGDPALKFVITRGDYSGIMSKMVENLEKAKESAANDLQCSMLEYYIESFTSGSLDAHKDGSRDWIKDKSPVVESYISFLETYRDPLGTKGEFEAFVAVVNDEISVRFNKLVEESTEYIKQLPWPAEFEKDEFLRPDFTSLDVITLAGSGVSSGINIPNYDDIRQDEGFKNVHLENVIASGFRDHAVIQYLKDADKPLFKKYKMDAFDVQVAIHELLGHGSGKLLQADDEGKLNFDLESTINPLTGEKVTSWYEPNESFYSKFSGFGTSYEECRAECAGLYLCLSKKILRIFGREGQEADDVVYINWLTAVRGGLMALAFYTPETNIWGQVHMMAAYVILRVLLEAGNDFVKVSRFTGTDGEPDMYVELDRSKIESVGVPAIGKFLQKLQVYKSTADYEAAKEMYLSYATVSDDEEPRWLHLREIAVRRIQHRKLLVQGNTLLSDDGAVILKEYEHSTSGLIQSIVERFPANDVDACLFNQWMSEYRCHVKIQLDGMC